VSRLFGATRQIGFVVSDLDRALAYWTQRLGIGPFFLVKNLPIGQFWYQGQPSPPPNLTLAISASGDLQVELIHQADRNPSGFLDRLRASGDGLQHVAAWVDRPGYDAEVARLRGGGVRLAHEGWIANGGPRFAFFATDDGPGGFQFEIADVADPQFSGLGTMIHDAAAGWDGTGPIREIAI